MSLRNLRVRTEPVQDRSCSYRFDQTKTKLAICGEQSKELIRIVAGIQRSINSVRKRCRRESPKVVPLPTIPDDFSNVNMVASNCSLALTVAESASDKCRGTKTKLETDIETLNKTLWETRCSCGIDCPAPRSAQSLPTLQPTPAPSAPATAPPSAPNATPSIPLANATNSYQVMTSIPPTNGSSAVPMVSINSVPAVQRVKSRITDEIRSQAAMTVPISDDKSFPVAPDAVMAEALTLDYDEPMWPVEEPKAKVRLFVA